MRTPPCRIQRRFWLSTTLAGLLAPLVAYSDDGALAVNFVAVDDRLHTAGQPSEETLGTLASQGYRDGHQSRAADRAGRRRDGARDSREDGRPST